MKKFIAFVLLIVAMAMLFGCGMAEPTDLTGKWVLAEGENNGASEDFQLELNISDDVIRVDFVSDNAKVLYWYGTYEAPTKQVDEYSWVSVNDSNMTSDSILAAQAKETTVKYENDKIYFDLTEWGVTYTFVFERDAAK